MKKFREVHQDQIMLLPPSLDEFIDKKHLVRILSTLIDRIAPRSLEDIFSGGGTPSYHPRMMLKVILYAYIRQLYSCRKIAKALREDLSFMWLSGISRPDFNTVNRFRSDYLRPILEDVYSELLLFLESEDYIDLKDYFVDGSKFEANAGKYTYVWRKNTERYRDAVKQRVHKLFDEIDKLNAEEDEKYGEHDLPERGENSAIKAKDIEDAAEAINKKLEEEPDKKKARSLKSRANKLKKEAEKLSKYEDQEAKPAGRNSYSKTDTDATFMRMKDDTLRAAYNVQLSTSNRFIVNYSISQNASDSSSFPAHLSKIDKRGKKFIPDTYTGDSAYGSQENYSLLSEYDIDNYLKYPLFHPEQRRSFRQNKFRRENMRYDEQQDCYQCAADKKLWYKEDRIKQTSTGFQTQHRIYECEDCRECPYASECKRGAGNRTVQVNPDLERYKAEARENLHSEKGWELRKRRGNEVESPFGDIKKNQKFTRFSLRGLDKVEHEFGLVSLAFNIRKYYKISMN